MKNAIEGINLQIEPSLLFKKNSQFFKRTPQFWLLQICGWLSYAVIVYFSIIRPKSTGIDFNLSGQLSNLIIETSIGFTLSYLQWSFIKRIIHQPVQRTLLFSFVNAIVLGFLFNTIKLGSYKVIVYGQAWHEHWNSREFGGWFLFSLTTMMIWTAFFLIMLYNSKLQNEHKMLLRAQNLAKESQLQMLRYQLNPHFMFNTMNAIYALILKKETQNAADMLEKFCSFFRYSLDKNTSLTISLYNEIEFIQLYLSIEKVRFGDRLSVSTHIDKATYQAQVPTLLLQPVVENAVKYGIESQKGNGEITISTKTLSDQIIIEVFNTGANQNYSSTTGFGIGLANTRERLSTMFNNNFDINLAVNDQGTIVTIKMPFIRGSEND